MNTVSCGDEPQVGFSFASALWALDTLFAMARVGVDGVNIHSSLASTTALFKFTRRNGDWWASVEPEYYGLLMFAQAAPPGSRLLRVAGAGAVRAWATRAPDGHIRLVLINPSASEGETIEVNASGRAAEAPATLEALRAPSLSASSGVTLGGQSFGADTQTGQLTPQASSVSPHEGHLVVVVPAASAALLTLPR
jgi:Glycosyl hydrolase family 79 C-terminal beta domain